MRKILVVSVVLALVGVVPAHASGVPPVANDDEATAVRPGDGDPAEVEVDVLENDTDAEDDDITMTSADITSTEGGAVDCDVDSGICLYEDPGGPAPFDDTFTYEISDGTGSDTGTVTIHVEEGAISGPELVVAERTVTLRQVKHNVKRTKLTISGNVAASGNTAACMDHVPVDIYRGANKLKTVETSDATGYFVTRVADRKGLYKAVATAVLRHIDEDTDVDCLEAEASKRHRHS